jgi:hypothetical protein
MWHRVGALFGCTVHEAQSRLSSAEFVDWCAFYAIEPWGFEADTWRMGMVCAATANFSGRVKKPLKAADFIPRAAGKRKQKISADELKMRLQADIEKANNG